MAQADGVVANGTGAAVRADINDQLAAVFTNHSGSSEPGTTYAYQWWADTNANVLKIRNSANNAWITLRELDGTMLIEDGSASTPGLAFADDVNTGIFSPAADQIGFATGGAERLEIGSSEVVFNDPSNDVDFRVESNGNTHMLFVDAGNDAIGIATSSPGAPLAFGKSVYGEPSSEDFYRIKFADAGGTENDVGIGMPNANSLGFNTVSNGSIRFYTGTDGESARIDDSGRLLVGTSSSRATHGSGEAQLQIEGTNTATAGVSVTRTDNSAGGATFSFGKTRNGSVVQSGDDLGTIHWQPDDGTDLATPACSINAEVDGTPGSNDMPGRLVFSTTADGASSPTERVRIDSSGNLLIGRTSVGSTGNGHTIRGGDSAVFSRDATGETVQVCRNNSQGDLIQFRRNATVCGEIVNIGATSVSYNTSSDYRLKENVVALLGGIDRVKQLKPSRFNFIAEPEKTVDGFLAHEAQTVVPECASGVKDWVDEEGNPKMQGIDHAKLVPLLTAALQEAIAKIETLETKVAALEAS